MTNLDFFKASFSNEMKATLDTIRAIPADQLEYTPHPINRTAYEIAEHIAAHVFDFGIILQNDSCDERLSFPFSSPDELASKTERLWTEASNILSNFDAEKWDNDMVFLSVGGNPFGSMPRFQMMWFFLNDIIHHRGQLSAYLRPMGGKNPAIYGWSADTVGA
jgi:uncharacterized damage-inducible protein DinB